MDVDEVVEFFEGWLERKGRIRLGRKVLSGKSGERMRDYARRFCLFKDIFELNFGRNKRTDGRNDLSIGRNDLFRGRPNWFLEFTEVEIRHISSKRAGINSLYLTLASLEGQSATIPAEFFRPQQIVGFAQCRC